MSIPNDSSWLIFKKDPEKIEKIKEEEQVKRPNIEIKREWYEKFRWFISSEGFLVIGGRDATSNEIVIKKHADKNDLVFHTDIKGSPFHLSKQGWEHFFP